jgi:hypothetical protein
VHSHTEKENEMSHANLSRRAIVAGAASVPALALPAAAGAGAIPATDPELIALGERLKVMMPRVAALGLKSHASYDEACADLPAGWARDGEHMRIFNERSAKNGHDRAYDAWNAASDELHILARAVLNMPSADRVGDGIRAAASIALDDDDRGNAFNMADVLWEMAERAGFTRPEEDDDEAVQS